MSLPYRGDLFQISYSVAQASFRGVQHLRLRPDYLLRMCHRNLLHSGRLTNLRLDLNFARDKRSSLFCSNVSDEDKISYDMDARSLSYKEIKV